jgi:hypothetical protein
MMAGSKRGAAENAEDIAEAKWVHGHGTRVVLILQK